MRTKKILSVLLATAVMSAMLTGCGGDDATSTNSGTSGDTGTSANGSSSGGNKGGETVV